MRVLAGLIAGIVVFSAPFGGGAAGAKEDAPGHQVIRENATIPVSSNFSSSYSVQADGSLLFRLRDRWFRAEVSRPCQGSIKSAVTILFVSQGAWFDRSSQVIVDGFQCRVQRLDEIAAPGIVEAIPH